jgi:hypothetical protein
MVIDGKQLQSSDRKRARRLRYYVEAKARTRKIGNWKTSAGEIVVGQFAGFDLSVSIPTAAADGPCFLLKGGEPTWHIIPTIPSGWSG